MAEYISREAAIAYIREQSEECQKAFEEIGGESGIYADAYNDLAEDFYRIPAADVAPVVHGRWEQDADGDWYCTNCNEVVAICGIYRSTSHNQVCSSNHRCCGRYSVQGLCTF